MAKLVVNKNETRTQTYSNVTLSGLLFVFPQWDDDGDMTMVTDADLAKITVKVIEERDGQKVNVLPPKITMQDLKNLLYANRKYYQTNGFEKAIEQTNILPLNFGTPKALKGNHNIYVELEVGNTTISKVEVYEKFAVGVENSQLIIEELELESSRNDYTLELGSFVEAVHFKGWNVSAIDTMQVKSDIMNADYDRLQILQQVQETNIPTEFANTNLVTLLDATQNGNQVPFSGLNVRLRFTATGANRKLYIVRRVVTAEIANNYIEKSQEHRAENLSKVRKADFTNACACSAN